MFAERISAVARTIEAGRVTAVGSIASPGRGALCARLLVAIVPWAEYVGHIRNVSRAIRDGTITTADIGGFLDLGRTTSPPQTRSSAYSPTSAASLSPRPSRLLDPALSS